MQNCINRDGRDPSADDIDGIVSLDIDGGQTHQHEQWQHAVEEEFVTTAPGQNHEDGGDANVTAGEGCCGTFARIVGTLHQAVEETVAVARHVQCLIVGGEIIVDVGEDALRDALRTYCQIVILRPCDRQEDEDDVIDKERRENNELRAVELLIAAEKVEQRHQGNHREIG